MNTQTDLNQIAHERVAHGAAALDEIKPDWIDVLDPDKLDMAYDDSDVISQLYGKYNLDRNRVARAIDPNNAHLYEGGERSEDDPDLPVVQLMARYGFTLLIDPDEEDEADDQGVTFDDLTDAWLYELAERQAIGEQAEEEAEEAAEAVEI